MKLFGKKEIFASPPPIYLLNRFFILLRAHDENRKKCVRLVSKYTEKEAVTVCTRKDFRG